MFVRDTPRSSTTTLEVETSKGWSIYRQALECLDQSDWSRALVLLAEAETTFRTSDDYEGLWRTLIGQALLHWREGGMALAIARALAALHAAETIDDGFAVGCVAWQIANMMLEQGEHRKAADFLDQAQRALDALGMAPPGGTLAAAAQLCIEIVRWQQMCGRQQIGQHEAEAAIAEIQRDLIGRLNQATSSLRATPVAATGVDGAEGIFLMTGPPAMLALPDSIASQTSLSGWLARLWRRLIYGGEAPAVESLSHAAAVVSSIEPDAEATPVGENAAQSHFAERVAVEPAPPAATLAGPPQVQEHSTLVMVGTTTTDTLKMARPSSSPEDAEKSDLSRAVESSIPPTLMVHLLGQFRVTLNDCPVASWPSGRGRAVFKYLLTHRDRPVPRDVLMEVFWPEASPASARNSLNVALHGLRQALRAAADVPVVVFQNGAYRFDSTLRVWVDVDEFRHHVQAGRRLEDAGDLTAAAAEYEQATSLYQGDFMADDLADDWPVLVRERQRVAYVDTLDRLSHIYFSQEQYASCVTLCQLILAQDNCREDAHCRLIRCYSRQGQHHLALRQYQICLEALRKELDVEPAPTTTQLYEHIRRREQV
jgi:DNA-binding SARP family transcriptional activator